MIVLDASLMMTWLLGEDQPLTAQTALHALPDTPIVVPAHWPAEISNALCFYLRGGQVTIRHLQIFMAELDRFDLAIEQPMELDEIGALANFAVAHRLTAYDASYVQLALRHRAILATLDEAMRVAAQRLDVPLLPA